MATTSGQIRRFGRDSQGWKGWGRRGRDPNLPPPSSSSAFQHEWRPEARLDRSPGQGLDEEFWGAVKHLGPLSLLKWGQVLRIPFPQDLLGTHVEWSGGLWAP